MTFRGGLMGRLQSGQEEGYSLRQVDREALRLLWRYLRPHGRQLAVAGLAMLAVTAVSVAMPYLSKVAVDRYIAQLDATGLAVIAGLYLALNGVFWVGSYWQCYLSGKLGQAVVYALRRDLHRHVLRQSMAFFSREPVGQVTSRLTNDVNALSEVVSGGVLNLVADLVTMGGVVVVMLAMSPSLTFASLLPVPLVVLSMSALGKQMRRAHQQVQQELAQVNTGVEQGVTGMRVVQSLARESISMEQFESLSMRNMRANLRVSLLFAAVFPTMTITNMLGTALVLGYGGYLVSQGAITFGVLLAFLTYVTRFFSPLRELSLVYSSLQAAGAAADRIHEYMRQEPGVPEPQAPQRPAGGFRGEVAFEGVTFGYGDEDVLRGVSLRIAAGQTVALVGATGAGKTSIARLLARLYDVQDGQVRIDGVDVREISREGLRSLVTVVPQEVFLFADTIRENIRYGNPDASDAQVEEAARRAQAHTFIQRLPDGYDSYVGEVGALLSGGQKQMIALARALLADPRILILDEATASVDAHTEARMQQAMEEARRGRTTLIIAHRFTTLRLADQIAVVNEGTLEAQGTHEELMQCSETYRRLYERQWA